MKNERRENRNHDIGKEGKRVIVGGDTMEIREWMINTMEWENEGDLEMRFFYTCCHSSFFSTSSLAFLAFVEKNSQRPWWEGSKEGLTGQKEEKKTRKILFWIPKKRENEEKEYMKRRKNSFRIPLFFQRSNYSLSSHLFVDSSLFFHSLSSRTTIPFGKCITKKRT